ncbi:hypothetical protein ACNOYE_18215 [Nannocystaceae bacterium ST9]
MLFLGWRSWVLAWSFVVAGLSSCTPRASVTEESEPSRPSEPSEPSRPAAAEAPLGHEFLRLTDAGPDLIAKLYFDEELSVDDRFEFALDPRGSYYVGVGRRVLAVDRGAAEPRVLELPMPLTLLGIHGEDLILIGGGYETTNVYRLACDGKGTLQTVGPFDVNHGESVLVGDHVAGLAYGRDLRTLALATGELRRTPLTSDTLSPELVVAGDRLLWPAHVIVDEAGTVHRSLVHRSRAPFDEIELVFQLDGTIETEQVVGLAQVGDDIVYLAFHRPDSGPGSVQLQRRTADRTELLMSDLEWASLVQAAGSAWLVIGKDHGVHSSTSTGLPRPPPTEMKELWHIGPGQPSKVETTTPAKLVTGTPWGLAWIEEHDRVVSFHLAGEAPPGFVAAEAPARILESSVVD